ncbi:MAG: CoA-binding protein [Chloroflexi bacterium]|nr:CoA-binding protein [Chloroflexota bacterium]
MSQSEHLRSTHEGGPPSASPVSAEQEGAGHAVPPAVAPRFQDPKVIRKILGHSQTIAIVGLSPNRLRPSFFVGQYLQYRGYRIVPINPRADEILGERSYPSLAAIPFPVDVVDVFRDPSAALAIADEAIQIGASALWLQFGVLSPEAAERAEAAGLDAVMDRCMKIEHGRYFGEMHWFGLNTGVVTSRRPSRRLSQG